MAGLSRIDPAAGVVDGVNRHFTLPNPYVAGTLVVMRNGVQLVGDLDNGWIERDPAAGIFEMLVPPRSAGSGADDPGDLMSAYYENASENAGGGADGGVPGMRSGRDVRPKLCAIDDIAPKIPDVSIDGEDVPTVSTDVVAPRTCAAKDIRPRMVKAEEI
jgi:hypothetical protein